MASPPNSLENQAVDDAIHQYLESNDLPTEASIPFDTPHHTELEEIIRTSMPSEEYIKRHQIYFYLKDVILQLLERKSDAPLEFISQYFTQVEKGLNVLNRPFLYVQKTARNRLYFVELVRQIYSDFPKITKLSGTEVCELIFFVCPDFPKKIIRFAHKIASYENELLSLKDQQSGAATTANSTTTATKTDAEKKPFEDLQESLQGGGGDMLGGDREKFLPILPRFLIYFNVFFFYSEFLFILMENVFENNFKKTLTVDELLEKIDDLFTSFASKKEKYTFCMPSPQKIKHILDKSIISRLKPPTSISTSQSTESFLDFCCYLTHFIETQCDGEVVGVMSIRESPITAKYSRIQKEKLKSEFNSTMMLVNLRKNKGGMIGKEKKKKTNNTSSGQLLPNSATNSNAPTPTPSVIPPPNPANPSATTTTTTTTATNPAPK